MELITLITTNLLLIISFLIKSMGTFLLRKLRSGLQMLITLPIIGTLLLLNCAVVLALYLVIPIVAGFIFLSLIANLHFLPNKTSFWVLPPATTTPVADNHQQATQTAHRINIGNYHRHKRVKRGAVYGWQG